MKNEVEKMQFGLGCWAWSNYVYCKGCTPKRVVWICL